MARDAETLLLGCRWEPHCFGGGIPPVPGIFRVLPTALGRHAIAALVRLKDSKRLQLGSIPLLVVTSFYSVSAHAPNIYFRKNGFLRYWTLSNLPLFVLASPMLYVLFQSSFWAWREQSMQLSNVSHHSKIRTKPGSQAGSIFNPKARSFVFCLALMQSILGFMTLTSAHVQIITRIASGYPLWYWWVGTLILRQSNAGMGSRGTKLSEWSVKWMVLYGIIQAGLFACFLPPA